MSNISELAAYFPGERSRKEVVQIWFKRGTIDITYSDGETVTLVDPVQVQDIKLPPGRGREFMKRLREVDPYASKGCYYERAFLESIKDTILNKEKN